MRRLLPDQRWIGCFDHLIELVAGIPFHNDDVKGPMAKARHLVGAITGSPLNKHRLELRQKSDNVYIPNFQPLRIIQDVDTRWWSTWRMTDRLVTLRTAL